MRTSSERGVAMITTLLVMMLISALLIGFTTLTMSDQRFRFIDKDRTQAFYAASAGLEKMTADLGNLFFVYVAPTPAQITALTATAPTIPSTNFTKLDGSSGYQISSQNLGSTTISTGPFQGLYGLITKYTMDVTARTSAGGETHLRRETETVAIPLFQFGIFSDVDLSFFAGPDFDFGGRVHTNGNLFLSEGGGSTLTLRDKVTAVKEIVRQRLQNGALITTAPTHDGIVKMATATNAFRNLAATEGSVVDGVGSALNEPPPLGGNASFSCNSLSLSTYNAYIRSGRTGAKALNLPLITFGGQNADLVRRPVQNENINNPTLLGERYYSKVSLRILLSDTAPDIMNLPGVVAATQPVSLVDDAGDAWPPAGFTPATPIARSPGTTTLTTGANTVAPGAAPAGNVTLNAAIPATWPYSSPTLTLAAGAPLVTIATINCASMTATQFTGCVNTAGGNIPAIPNPTTISLTVNGVTVSTTTGAKAAGTPRSYTVPSTTGFIAQNSFWLSNTLVTCDWLDLTAPATPTFTTCKNTPATNAPQTVTNNALSAKDTGLIGGYIKIEMQDTTGAWRDVTMEILNRGIAGRNIAGGVTCPDPNSAAILRLQRLKDNAPGTAACSYGSRPYDYWPNVLFDPREALQRDTAPASGLLVLGGVMHYITLDVANLSKWFQCAAPYNVGVCSGNQAMSNSGYSVYFSDRRNNRDGTSKETGEYGWEDFVNPSTGVPNGVLDAGEDVNASNLLETYGKVPSYKGQANSVPAGATAPLNLAATPLTELSVERAKVNRAILFRHALKLINGGIVGGVRQLVTPGLTIVAENPIYVQGDWNASQAGFASATDVAQHVATSVVGDAVTLLSNNWNDNVSFLFPYTPGSRPRDAQTFYRMAIIGGKGPAFPQPANTATDFGTDGGAHNFLRYLEGNAGGTLNYLGSIATFYYNRQAVGTYKCCTTVYEPPTRKYAFDIDFLDATKLPPLTPVFRDLNTIGFSQEIRPGR